MGNFKRCVCFLSGILFLACNNYGLRDILDNPGASSAHANSGYRIFVTSQTPQGNIGSTAATAITSADSKCMNDSNKPPGNSTYKALLVNASRRACSTANCTVPSENLDWVIHPNANYVRADGKTPLFTSNSAGIFVLSGIGAPTFTNSVAETVASVWTGLGTDWRTANACSDWTDGTSSFTGMVGDTSKFNSDAISTATAYNCDFQLSFLCVEQ